MVNKHLKNFFADVTSIPPDLQRPHFYSLDGLRGVAIIMVVLSHLNLSAAFAYHLFFNGELGVVLFFVLSGFLITSLCLKEKVATGNLSLKNFYIRRVLRIFPVAYLYLLVILVLNFVFKLNIYYLNFIGAALYLMDITSIFRKYNFTWHTAHFWSLSIEEQFYLVMPFLLKKNFRLYLLLILFVAFILPPVIFLQYQVPVLNAGLFYVATHVLSKFQPIAIGCLFAVLLFKYPKLAAIPNTVKIITNLLAIAVVLYLRYDNFFSMESVVAGLVISLLAGYIIVTNLAPSPGPVFWLLNTKLLKRIGILSYSIYIWQQVFTSNDQKLPHFMIAYPYNILCIIVVSCASYYLYERFFLNLKKNFSRLKT
ncbi:MAG TPA: acyltransferase [Mucilaginibacter sp.]|nr:acyltransferase [Mucilaginibacter sp.]